MTDPVLQHQLLIEHTLDQLIGRRLQDARQAQHLSLDQLAILSGYSKDELCDYERAEISIPIQRAMRLSRLLDVDLTAVPGLGGTV